MAKIYNSDCIKGLQKNAGIQQNVDKTPNELAEKIVPTFETNPLILTPMNVVAAAGSAASGTTTIYTTPSVNDFYLTNMNVAYTCNAASDNNQIFARVTPQISNAITTILKLVRETGAAGSDHAQITFNPPLLLAKNSTITLSGTFTAGTMTKECQICGIEIFSSA